MKCKVKYFCSVNWLIEEEMVVDDAANVGESGSVKTVMVNSSTQIPVVASTQTV